MEGNEHENENEGLSTGKKVVAGAAIGVAVPTAVGVAKKLIGNGDDQSDGPGETDRPQRQKRTSGRSTRARRSGSTTTRKRAASTAKRTSGSTRSSSSTRSKSARSSSSTSGRRRSGSSSGGGSNRTKEQLYNQAKRLGIEGRSTMTKAQLERAINRARSRS